MKKLILIAVLLSQITFGQKLTKDELVTKLSEETCECTSTQEIKKENFEMILGVCMLKGVNKYQKDVDKHFGKDLITNESVMEELGREIGMKMALNCPSFLQLIMDSDENFFDDEEENEESDEQISGIYKKTSNANFLTVEVVETSGKKHEFVLLHDFDNAYMITDSVLKQNENVTITYYILDIYDVKSQRFVNYKIISDITKN